MDATILIGFATIRSPDSVVLMIVNPVDIEFFLIGKQNFFDVTFSEIGIFDRAVRFLPVEVRKLIEPFSRIILHHRFIVGNETAPSNSSKIVFGDFPILRLQSTRFWTSLVFILVKFEKRRFLETALQAYRLRPPLADSNFTASLTAARVMLD
jgi:hypothetical protein